MRFLGLAATMIVVATSATGADVTGVTLIDADVDLPVAAFDPLNDGAVIDLAALASRNLNIRANVSAPVGSVRFAYDGVANYRTENVAPYALEGDAAGDYAPWTPTVGVHTLDTAPYVGADGGGGLAGASSIVVFTVVDGSANQSPIADAGPDRFLALPSNSTTLDGTLSRDDDGTIAAWSWSQMVGPSATVAGEATDTLLLTDLVEGIYLFRLTVTDDGGASTSDTATIGVTTTGAIVTGERKKWHRVSLSFDGMDAGEEATPNPFRDYRLSVTFDHAVSGTSYRVPGFYAADGSAADSSATSGRTWRVHFRPDEEGDWTYAVSFRTGPDIAADLSPTAGAAVGFDGLTGSITIGPSDKSGRDHRAHGRLDYVGERYLRFVEGAAPFLKAGADSPENFLGYFEFDDTVDHAGAGNDLPGGLHQYPTHVTDWLPEDPSWQGGKGKGIIGALNYLSSKGMNSVYFLTMNAQGDGREVYPWTTYDLDYTRFDCSKLDQWEIVFQHMDAVGIQLHVLLQETENDQLLNNGDLGVERALYYREMIARFGHHLALEWNLGEETSRTQAQHEADSQFIKELDPYDHPIVLHTFPGQQDAQYAPLLGWPHLDGPSIQSDGNGNTHARSIEWIDRSAAAGHPWFVCLDEQNPANAGVVPDADDYAHDAMRKEVLWGNLMAGGAGVEWYFGYSYPHSDLDCEDWRSRDHMWELTRIAIDFFHDQLPFTDMDHADALVTGGAWCLAKPGEVYAIYLDNGGTTSLDLSAATGQFSVRWFDPRNGGALQTGTVTSVTAGGVVAIGDAPSAPGEDWAVLVRRPGDLHRGVVTSLGPGWQTVALPLDAANDDETPPFPVAMMSPGAQPDTIPVTAPLVLYRYLATAPATDGNGLLVVRTASGVEIRY